MIHVIAAAVHGSLVSLHLTGVAYNILKGNYKDVAIHAGAAIYSAASVVAHAREVRRESGA